MRLRYTGEAEGKDLQSVHFPRNKWVDLTAASEETRVRLEHIEIAARSLDGHPEWELEAVKKSRKPTTTSNEEQS